MANKYIRRIRINGTGTSFNIEVNGDVVEDGMRTFAAALAAHEWWLNNYRNQDDVDEDDDACDGDPHCTCPDCIEAHAQSLIECACSRSGNVGDCTCGEDDDDERGLSPLQAANLRRGRIARDGGRL
jgi:hypothetical protein